MPAPILQTTGASWTNSPIHTIAIPPDSVSRVVYRCMASDHGAEAAEWRLEATVKRVGSGAVQFVGITSFLEALARKTIGAATWDVRAVLESTAVTFDVRGGIGQTVDWLPDTDGAFSMEGPLP